MKVKIKLFATLRKFGPEEQVMELPEGATVEDAIQRIDIPGNLPLLKIVNGEHRPPRHLLKEGDELALFPPIAGGGEGAPIGVLSESCRKDHLLMPG